MTTKLFTSILAIEECSGIALTIPGGETVEYESSEIVLGVADLRWNGETYFANLGDVLEAARIPDDQLSGISGLIECSLLCRLLHRFRRRRTLHPRSGPGCGPVLRASVAVGTTIADRPRTDPYKRVDAYG